MTQIPITLVRIEDRTHLETTARHGRTDDGGDSYDIEVDAPGGAITGSGSDAFGALTQVRRRLEELGWLVAVEGARPDRWPSGMARDMGDGLRVYVLDGFLPEQVVPTLAPTDPESVTTYDAQASAARRLLRSARRRPPHITEEMRKQATAMPGAHLYAIDPGFDPAGAVPPEGIIGAYPVDEQGSIVEGGFVFNDRYRPTPAAKGFPEPTDPLDDVCQRAATGWATHADVVDVLERSTILPGPLLANRLFVFSHPDHVRHDRAGPSMSGRDAIDGLAPGCGIQINPSSSGLCDLDAETLRPPT